jgi:putative membrane protein
MRLTQADHARVTAAVAQAERATDGEIVTVVAGQSDAYHDVALHWTVLGMLLALAVLATWPGLVETLHGIVADPWSEPPTIRAALTTALIVAAVAFLLFRLLFAWAPLRLALTPRATKARRVRRRALGLFRASAEQRTRAATGVLLYLSLAEHRAEIIADATIHTKVTPDVWGEAMAALILGLRDNRPGDGMAEAVAQIGAVLAEHFPRSHDDTNELPDRLIVL